MTNARFSTCFVYTTNPPRATPRARLRHCSRFNRCKPWRREPPTHQRWQPFPAPVQPSSQQHPPSSGEGLGQAPGEKKQQARRGARSPIPSSCCLLRQACVGRLPLPCSSCARMRSRWCLPATAPAGSCAPGRRPAQRQLKLWGVQATQRRYWKRRGRRREPCGACRWRWTT